MKIINDISKVAVASLILYGSYNTASCSQEAEKDVDYSAFRGGGFGNRFFDLGYHHGGGFPADSWHVAEGPTQSISLEEGGNGLFVLNIVNESSSFMQIPTAGTTFDTLEEVFSDIATSQKPLRSIYVKNFELTSEDFDALCYCIETQKEALTSLYFSGIEITTEQLATLVKALEDIQHFENFSLEFNDISFSGETIDEEMATLICYGFDSLRINEHNKEHNWSEAVQLALSKSASEGTKISKTLWLGTTFRLYNEGRLCFWGNLGQIDLSWLKIIPDLLGTVPNLTTLELNGCGPNFIEKLAECLSNKLAISQETAIPLHVIIDEWEQTRKVIEVSFQLPVSDLEIMFRQATYKYITPFWPRCFENEALKSIELCFASDICPIDFWRELKNPDALKNLQKLKVGTRAKREPNLTVKTLCAIITNHGKLVELDIPNLRSEESTTAFSKWCMKYKGDGTCHKTVKLRNVKDPKTVDAGDILLGALKPEMFYL